MTFVYTRSVCTCSSSRIKTFLYINWLMFWKKVKDMIIPWESKFKSTSKKGKNVLISFVTTGNTLQIKHWYSYIHEKNEKGKINWHLSSKWIFCGDKPPFCGATGALFWTLVDSVHGFQSQDGFIITSALLLLVYNDPESQLWIFQA